MDKSHLFSLHDCAHAQLLSPVTLCNPMNFTAHQSPLPMPVLPPGDLPNLGIKPESLVPPALAGIFFYQ